MAANPEGLHFPLETPEDSDRPRAMSSSFRQSVSAGIGITSTGLMEKSSKKKIRKNKRLQGARLEMKFQLKEMGNKYWHRQK